ncbi:MAG TPA: hypothetical protein VNO79_01425 [Actinomycetota bacterium]|nr:hypothetical protein [Actinomycetota bacterium]
MVEVVYEGPDDVLVVGTVELSRGVPVEVSPAVAKLVAGRGDVRVLGPAGRRRGRAQPQEEAED